MILIPFLAALLAAAPVQASKPATAVVQTPVDDPVLPTGPLASVGAAAEGDFYMDVSSFARSDIPDTIDITTVIVRKDPAEPLLVALTWVNCAKGVYQISSGRTYDAKGKEVRRTTFVRDKVYAAESGPARFAAAYCSTKGPGLGDAPAVADYGEALAVAELKDVP